jgi:hypothetical protein
VLLQLSLSSVCCLSDCPRVAPGLDGVAPRAKLNQQRARRFVSALEKPARDDYSTAPPWFDGNCITPGTAFMHALGDALAFLVRQKMGQDSRWADLEVVLSSTAVPGEGEHKIMEFIRQRADPPSTVHCAYGADADLLLLGLASHEPHFLVIREVPDYSSMKPSVGGPEVRPQRSCAAMEYMSIAVLREYLRRDLCSPAAAGFFDIERAIDDFVLCSFLCGNDFLPHLPSVDIADGALDAIVLLYRKMLPEWQDYLTLDGEIVVERFELFMRELSVLEPLVIGLKGATGKGGKRGRGRAPTGSEMTKKVLSAVNDLWEDRIDEDASGDPAGSKPKQTVEQISRAPKGNKRPGDWVCGACAVSNFANRTKCFKCGAIKSPEYEVVAESDDEDTHDWVDECKRDYYAQKLNIAPHSAQHRKLCREFLKGMAWTLKYYTTGCQSWSWYYPFHYAPFLSDMVDLSQHCIYQVGWELGQPYTPLQQLLSVLPPGSAWALPAAFRELMLDKRSPISDFYPAEFAQDANGKRNDWEATVLLDFVDERRLVAAAATVVHQVSTLEAERNSFAPPLRFRRVHDTGGKMVDESVASPLPGLFPDIRSSVSCWPDHGNSNAAGCYKAQLRPGAVCVPPPRVSLPLIWHPKGTVTGGLETPGGVFVFGEPKSTKNSVVLNLELAPAQGPKGNRSVDAYDTLCGAVVTVDWPWQRLAICTGLLAEDGFVGDPSLADLHFELETQAVQNKYRSERGIRLPSCSILVYTRPILYTAEVSAGSAVCGAGDAIAYPLSCVGQVDPTDWRVAVRHADPLQIGTAGMIVDRAAHFGALCKVVSSANTGKCVRVECKPTATASLAAVVARVAEAEGPWVEIDELCAVANISLSIAKQLTQDVHFRLRKEDYDCGLHYRFFKRGLLRTGFVRRKHYNVRGALVYSPKAVRYLSDYMKAVPELFDGLAAVEAKQGQPTKTRIGKGTAGQPFVAAEMFGQDLAESVLERCAAFRKTHAADIWAEPLYHNSSAVLDSSAVHELEHCLDAERRMQSVEIEVNREHLLLPGALTDSQHESLLGCQEEISPARATLGSRVAFTMSSGPVTFGTVGVVVGIHPPTIPEKASVAWTLDIVIASTPEQRCAIGGSSLGGRCETLRGISVPASHVINLGNDRHFPETDDTIIPNGFSDEETLIALQEQIEFYLSDRNLPKDSYFRPLVERHPNGFVSLPKFLSCNRVKQLTADGALVVQACRSSELLVVADDGKAIRRRNPLPIRAKQRKKPAARKKSGGTGKKIEENASTTDTAQITNTPTIVAEASSITDGADQMHALYLSDQREPRSQLGSPADSPSASAPESVDPARVASASCYAGLAVVSTTIVAAQVPLQLRPHAVLGLTAWPVCLLVGHAGLQWVRGSTHNNNMMMRKPPATPIDDTSRTSTLAMATGAVTGAAVLARRCGITMQSRLPSIESALKMVDDTSCAFHQARWTTAATALEPRTGLSPLLASNASEVVVALSLMPMAYVLAAACMGPTRRAGGAV